MTNMKQLYGILNYRSMEASKLLAMKAQQSAESMEFMTRDMHVIAQKTKQETVSMRIITLVTLFFLPGTFISVSLLVLLLSLVSLVRISHRFVHSADYWWVDRKESLQRHSQLGATAV